MQARWSLILLMPALCWLACKDGGPGRRPPSTRGKWLLLPMARFADERGADGKMRPKPGAARLVLLEKTAHAWREHVLEDPASRVFHKAACLKQPDGSVGVLTIAATDALLKLWTRRNGAWQADTWWHPSFGGKWDRLRDFELGDVDGDGEVELVIATHDQGVIAVAEPQADGSFKPVEVYRQADTFIHEIEIGDLDGDGAQEFFATPSRPNKAGASQAGGVLGFRYHKSRRAYVSFWVARFTNRHPKEILVADVDGDGRDELYVSLEARLDRSSGQPIVMAPLEVRRFVPGTGGTWQGTTLATLDGGIQARVLLKADLDGDGKYELVVTTMKGGVWRLLPPAGGAGPWRKELIDLESSGFEHAAGAFDLDGDKRDELYVVADDQDRVSRYDWTGSSFKRSVIYRLRRRDLIWSVTACEGLN